MKTYDVVAYSEKRDCIDLLGENIDEQEAYRVEQRNRGRFDNLVIDKHPEGVNFVKIVRKLSKHFGGGVKKIAKGLSRL